MPAHASAPADAPAPPPTPPAGARLVIERLAGVTVVGWAFDPAAPGREQLALVCGQQRFTPVVRRMPRADVARAVGVQGVSLGFQFELPLQAWQALAESGAVFGIAMGDAAPVVPAWRPHASSLRAWMANPVHGPEGAGAEAAATVLQRHLDEAERWASSNGAAADAPPLPLRCHVEAWRGLCLTGWLADTPEAREPLRLRCGNHRYEVSMRRLSRRDVAERFGLAHDDVGFELEVPGTLWQASDAEELELQVEGRQGPVGPIFHLRRSELAERLDDALALDDPVQRAQQALLAMEHLGWVGQLASISSSAHQALGTLAASVGAQSWLDDALRDPQALQARAAQAEALRKPFRTRARGRLGRWLLDPRHAQRALATLLWLRSKPWLRGPAARLEIALTRATGLFDKATYDEQIAPSDRADLPALHHYIEHGDARSLVPMVLFDARHYTGQLEGRRHPGVNRLLHYGLVGRRQGMSPCAWFDPAYYLKANADVQASGQDPLVHFVNWGWQERRRPAPRFEPTTGTRLTLLQRLSGGVHAGGAAHPIDPLHRYLLDGLPADAQPTEPGQLPWAVPTHLAGRDFLDLAPWRSLPARPAQPRVDVIVPVYAGAQETLRCLWSVLSAPVETPFELVVIDDCSPEPALSAHLRELATLGLIRLLVNEQNLGFVATVNIGLALHGDRDVVILNSDTRVHPGWLDRLAAHGQAESRAASVTPLSNNATVCSYPRMLHSNWEKLELDDAGLDALAAEANRGRHVEVPTGVGFCMWMRRGAIDAVGMLDTERFGRGYGEENDWCMRANAAGWVQLVASDVYVLHQGSVSFRAEASERTRAGVATLLQRHPDYQRRIDEWIAADPLQLERARLDAARLAREARAAEGGLVLMINHARGGGAARHEFEAAMRLRAERGLGVVALRPSRRPGCVRLASLGETLDLPALQAIALQDASGAVSPLLRELLVQMNVREVQLHHLIDHPPALRDLLPGLCAELGVPLEVTVHDYHFICPRINLVDASGRYCGEPERDTCDRCLQRDELGRAAGRIGPWRAGHRQLLARAQRVVVPDLDVAVRLSNYFPDLRAHVQPHEPIDLPAQRPKAANPMREVLVIGALSPIKGFDVLLGLARSQAAAQHGLRFTLLGHSPDDAALRAAGVQVLGRYDDATLSARIDELAPDLILLPSVWPETFCYVLTNAAASGRRVAVFDLGAQARRLKEANAVAIYLPIELAGKPEALVKRLTS